jgi:CDP-4-dehydro-6-deoxyglucose reductase, E1
MIYPLARETWGDAERVAAAAVIESGRTTMGARTLGFEARFAALLGVRRCVMVNSGSSANLLMAAALRYRDDDPLRPGDEVCVPAVGWATTYYPFHQVGLKLRLVDVDPATLNIDPDALAAAITPATRAVCLVHALGNSCAFDEIRAVIAAAEERHGHSITLLEDACEALGATYGDRQIGSHGAMASFSFFFSHHISTMEGGMVATDDDALADVLVCLRAHGWTRDLPAGSALHARAPVSDFERAFRFVLPGYNVRPTEVSAAAGLVQLDRLAGFVAERRRNAQRFAELLAPLSGSLEMQQECGDSSWFGLSVLVRPEAGVTRAELVTALTDAGVACRPIIAGNFARQPAIEHLDWSTPGSLPGADRVHDHGLFLGNDGRPLDAELAVAVAALTCAVTAADATSGARRAA